MLKSDSTDIAHIEFTSRCNLRCVFCAASQPNYKGIDLSGEMLKMVLDDLTKRKTRLVCVSGHGETTTYKDWHLYCNSLIKSGVLLHITSNFSKAFSNDELETLSKFHTIEISCDTADSDLFKRLRRGAKLENLIANLERLQEIVQKNRRKLHKISFSCVVSDKNVLGLKKFVDFGIQHGVEHFNFCNLTKYPPVKDGIEVNHVTEMPFDEMKKAFAVLTEVFEFLEGAGVEYYVQQGLMDSLREKIRKLDSGQEQGDSPPMPIIPEGAQDPENHKPKKYSSAREPLQTRDCLDPWSFFLVQSSGSVCPCCWHPPIGSISKGQPLNEILDNHQIRRLRESLLTGDLSKDCVQCPSRGWTSTEDLKRKVAFYLSRKRAWKSYLIRRSSPKIPARKPYEITFRSGWYALEKDPSIQEAEWQSWRWMAKDATCLIDNPLKPSTLIMRGAFDKLKFPDQKVVIELENQPIDEFVLSEARFYKEYRIEPRMLGKNREIILSIHTDRSFVPAECEPGSQDRRELGLQIHEIYFGERV
jgi:MoaA/NifB/PqqE/SkfB family radical SAM enzyme